jgi:predicted DNA-binding transcriptional regulator YafY
METSQNKMRRGMAKSERLREMERLYVQRAYSDSELAERLGVDRTTVYRDRLELERQVPFIQDEGRRWKIDRSRYLSDIRLNLNEALALYLAARRFSQQTRIAQPHVASGLEKLAVALRQPMTEQLVRAAQSVLSGFKQAGRVLVMETIARSWTEQITVRITYWSLKSDARRNTIVSPYLIEPSPWSDGVYLIGHSDYHGEVRTFKVERIEAASLTGETFEIPPSFFEANILQQAWGIWGGSGEPFKVVLRFAPGLATRRIKESVWHPMEEVHDLEDGGCEWRAPVAAWQEMMPWVRGWGAEVEVLQPVEMKQSICLEIERLVSLYGGQG